MPDTFTAEIRSAVPIPTDVEPDADEGPLYTFDVMITHADGKRTVGLYARQFASEGGDDLTEQIKLEIDVILDNLRAEQHADVGREIKVTL